MTDIIMKKKAGKFIKDLETKLNEKGYELVSYEYGSKSKHGTVTIKNPETQQTVETTFSPRTNPRAMKNLVSQIIGMFKGRGRRGQGEFKLSSDGPQREEWFGVLKNRGRRMSLAAQEEVDKIMRDGRTRSVRQIYDAVFDVIDKKDARGRKGRYKTLKTVPSRMEISSYMRGNKNYSNDGKGNWTYTEGGNQNE